MPRMPRSPALWVAMLAILLALGFLGSRGIWDTDEGRYTNVALNMLDSGDWLHPRRSDDVGHWTKPPLTYWAVAGSIAVFGSTPWAARLPIALAYLLSVWLTGRIARRIAPGSEVSAALIYATMLLPFGAAQWISTDYPLAAFETLAMWAYVEARYGGSPRWLLLTWGGFALAFMTKGPPALVPLLVIVLIDWWMPPGRAHRVLRWSGLGLFVLLALPWYLAVIGNTPGLLDYFVGDEVIGRVATGEFGRHGGWYGWMTIYAPTLVVGTLPWTPALGRWLRALPASIKRWRRDGSQRAADAPWLLLALWVWVPLLLFCLAQSRLPLYLLPLFVPLALLVAMQRQREGRALRWRWIGMWVVLLLGLKLAGAHWPTHKNAANWAEAIRERAAAPVSEVVFVEDMARYGLHLHLGRGTRIERISLDPSPQSRFDPSYDETLAQELAESEPDVVWICKQASWPQVQVRVAALGFHAVALGTPYRERIMFRLVRLR